MRYLIRYIHIFTFLFFILIMTCEIYAKNFVVVIDPGHGGKDLGAKGAISLEKNINLNVAKLLGNKISEKYNDVDIVYTRNNDKFLTLQKRADIANEAYGNLFISIHTNSISEKSPSRKTIAGASVYTLGLHKTDENLNVAQRENSVMVLENDFETTYSGFDPNSPESYIIFELNQSAHMEESLKFAQLVQEEFTTTAGRKDKGVRQAGFWVLMATTMPSVLVELDFICNPTVEKFLASTHGQELLAKSIFNAFVKYKDSYDNHNKSTDRKSKIASNIDDKSVDNIDNKIHYKIQFLTTPKPATTNQFKGLHPVDFYTEDNKNKYTYGNVLSLKEAQKILKTVKTKFPDAFIIRVKNGKRIK